MDKLSLHEWKTLIMLAGYVVVISCELFFPFFKNFTNKFVHDVRNLGIGMFNALLAALVFAGSFIWLSTWTEVNSFGLLNLFDLPAWLSLLLAVIIFDLWMYYWHRISHLVPFLWRFHRMHHTDRQMDASTALRFHFGEIIISFIFRLPVVCLLGMSLLEFLLYETLLQPVIIFHHSNVSFPKKLDSFLQWFLVTPNMHRVHHSDKAKETHSNFSSIFSFWDRLFGSFNKLADTKNIQYGLPQFENETSQTVVGMIKTPLK